MSTKQQIPERLVQLCDTHGLDYPEPGEDWVFTTEGDYDYDEIRRTLIRSGCDLNQSYQIDGGRRWEYTVPEPGWPDPLGYVTTDDPQWVEPQYEWKRTGGFYGNVRGSIPDSGDCDRHPNLPPDAYGLTTVSIYEPGSDPKLHAKTSIEIPDEKWVICLTYEQATRSSRSLVEVYSSELGEFPECTEWKSAHSARDERRHVELFDMLEQAVEFVREQTGLIVPDRPDRLDSPEADTE